MTATRRCQTAQHGLLTILQLFREAFWAEKFAKLGFPDTFRVPDSADYTFVVSNPNVRECVLVVSKEGYSYIRDGNHNFETNLWSRVTCHLALKQIMPLACTCFNNLC